MQASCRKVGWPIADLGSQSRFSVLAPMTVALGSLPAKSSGPLILRAVCHWKFVANSWKGL